MSKEQVKTIADSLGDDFISQLLKVSDHSIRNARWQGRFPASWFDALEVACLDRGLACPKSAFNFKSPSSGSTAKDFLPVKKVGDASPDIQGESA